MKSISLLLYVKREEWSENRISQTCTPVLAAVGVRGGADGEALALGPGAGRRNSDAHQASLQKWSGSTASKQ